jgi:hypothetical protein
MLRRRVALMASLVAPVAVAAGCSLINSYDAVKESPGDDATSGDDAPGDDVTASNDGTMVTESGSSGGGGDSASDVATGAVDGPAETTVVTGPEAAVDAGAPAGAIVIGGHLNTGTTYVLSVLDPVTGNVKNQEPMTVAGVAYDPWLDVWYIFDDGSEGTPFASPGSPVTLHVRSLDTRPGGTWAWTELATLSVPPVSNGQLIAPLINRLVYVAWAPGDGSPPAAQLTAIDTTNLGAATTDASNTPISSAPLPFNPTGLTGIPASGGSGGFVAVLQNTAANTAAGQFQFVTAGIGVNGIVVNNNDIPLGAAPNQQVAAGCGTSVTSQYGLMFATPFFAPDGGVSSATLQEFTLSGTNGSVVSTGSPSSIPFSGGATRFDPVAFSSCTQTAFVGEGLVGGSAPNLLFSLPVGGPSPPAPYSVAATSVSSLAFEPYSSTVIATGGSVEMPFILALRAAGTGSSQTLSNRALPPNPSWTPPTDLVTTYIAVRQPITFQCP